MRIIGIDPGEAWCGFASVDWDTDEPEQRYVTEFRTEARVFDVSSRGMVRTVHDVLFGLPAVVVVENYAQRPSGHNAFSQGNTLRLIGALELYTSQSMSSSWHLIPPGNAQKELPQIAPDFFKIWMKESRHRVRDTHKNAPQRSQFNHAFSAWRVLLRYAMKHEMNFITALRTPDVYESGTLMKSPYYTSVRSTDSDLSAQPMRWQVPRHIRL